MEAQSNRLGHLVDNFFLLFVGLKLADIITWSWWWITAPFWGRCCSGSLSLLCSPGESKRNSSSGGR